MGPALQGIEIWAFQMHPQQTTASILDIGSGHVNGFQEFFNGVGGQCDHEKTGPSLLGVGIRREKGIDLRILGEHAAIPSIDLEVDESGGKDIPVEKALDHVFGYGVGLDMTRRDVQGEAKKMGRPWEMGKAFDESAPCTALKTVAMVGHPAKGAIWLKVNGVVKQKGDLSELIWNIPETISYLSKMITLRPGDLIMSGTPAGVGPVQKGDVLEGFVEGVGSLSVTYAK